MSYGAPPARALVFDIETRIDWSYVHRPEFQDALQQKYEPPESYTDPVKIAAHHTGFEMEQKQIWALSPLTACIVAISWADLWKGDVKCVVNDDDETDLIAQFAEALSPKPQILTGFNVRGFDVPFLTARASACGVDLPGWWPHDRDYRLIADVFDVVMRRGGLDQWLDRLGLPPKTGSGADVECMTLAQLYEYSANDTWVERQLVQRFAQNMPALRHTRPVANYEEVSL